MKRRKVMVFWDIGQFLEFFYFYYVDFLLDYVGIEQLKGCFVDLFFFISKKEEVVVIDIYVYFYLYFCLCVFIIVFQLF